MRQEIFNIWLFYLATAAPLGFLIAFLGRRRAEWKVWEMSIFVVPFSVWFFCSLCSIYMGSSTDSKGILQPFAESFVLGLGVPIFAMVRTIVGRKRSAWPFSAILIAVLSLIGMSLAMFVPRLMSVD